MGIKYIWDTNIAIYYVQQLLPPDAGNFIENSIKDGMPCFSAITEIELLCWKASNAKDFEILHNFISGALVIELERPIKLKTVEIRRQHKIKIPDAIIAATALVYNLPLVTRNISDFKNIQGLELIDPFNLS